MLNVRNPSNERRRAVSISPNGVTGWSKSRFDPLLREPFCMASIARVSQRPDDDRNRIVWANPDNLTRSGQVGTANVGGHDRKRVTVKMSYDEGKTWPVSRVLESDWSGYTDLAVGPDGTIYCLYERGCINNLMWDVKSVCIARFNRQWLREPSLQSKRSSESHSSVS